MHVRLSMSVLIDKSTPIFYHSNVHEVLNFRVQLMVRGALRSGGGGGTEWGGSY